MFTGGDSTAVCLAIEITLTRIDSGKRKPGPGCGVGATCQALPAFPALPSPSVLPPL